MEEIFERYAPNGWRLLQRSSKSLWSTGRTFVNPRIVVVTLGEAVFPDQIHALLHELAHARLRSGSHNEKWEADMVWMCKQENIPVQFVMKREEIYSAPLMRWAIEEGVEF